MVKAKIQSFGRFLSSMIMPNIGALIAYGFLAAFFNPNGWMPNENFATIYSAMMTYLIPIMIAYTGGKLIHGTRGGVAGAIACMGAIMSDTTIPMLMASMIMGPLGGWCIKMFDKLMDGHTPAGFEMLIDNFSIGIIGLLLALLGYVLVGPLMKILLDVLSRGVEFLISVYMLPALAIFIEPAKVLFLNNAINHGLFTPLATAQAAETGKSILFMLETNPGPGFGVLLAYMFFCKDKNTRQSAPGAVIIHLFGGIHEIYFPYILMNPFIIIAPIIGNMAAIAWFSFFDCGLTGPASPGSIIAFMMMCPADKMLFTFIGFLIASVLSFGLAIPFARKVGSKDLEEAQKKSDEMHDESKGEIKENNKLFEDNKVENFEGIKKIVFACDAGMGSSAMGSTRFKKRLKDRRPDINVIHSSVDTIPDDCDVAVVQKTLVERAKKSAPNALIVTINNFLDDPSLDKLYESLIEGGAIFAKTDSLSSEQSSKSGSLKNIMKEECIKLSQDSISKKDAINKAGDLLYELGYVDKDYIDAMQSREEIATTYMGMGVAIPHGTDEAKSKVKKSGVVMFQYPNGVDFGNEKAYLVFGIAGVGNEHLDVLGKICSTLEDTEVLEKLKNTSDVDWVLKQLT